MWGICEILGNSKLKKEKRSKFLVDLEKVGKIIDKNYISRAMFLNKNLW